MEAKVDQRRKKYQFTGLVASESMKFETEDEEERPTQTVDVALSRQEIEDFIKFSITHKYPWEEDDGPPEGLATGLDDILIFKQNEDDEIEFEDPHVRDKFFRILRRNNEFLFYCDSPIQGRGIRGNKWFKAGEPIVEYIGELVRKRICEKREAEYESEGNNGSYIFMLNDDEYIDATKRGGLARYINHSCGPNCDSIIVHAYNKRHVVIYAIKDIPPMTELTYDYKLPYELKEKRIRCLCGSVNCRGWLNWSEEGEAELRFQLGLSQEQQNILNPQPIVQGPNVVLGTVIKSEPTDIQPQGQITDSQTVTTESESNQPKENQNQDNEQIQSPYSITNILNQTPPPPLPMPPPPPPPLHMKIYSDDDFPPDSESESESSEYHEKK